MLTIAARLRRVVTRPIVRDVAIFAATALLVRALLARAIQNPPGTVGELALTILSLLVGLLVVQATRWWRLRGFIPQLRHLQEYDDPAARDLVRALVNERLSEISGFAESLTRDRYDVTAPETIAPWVDTLFRQGGDHYRGVDTHSPSGFMDTYSWYLELHERSMSQRPFSASRDVRILCASPEDLRQDYSLSPHKYLEFFDWHAAHDVDLRWISPQDAKRLRQIYGLVTADVALWPHFAVLFEVTPTGTPVRLGIRFPKSHTGPTPRYNDIRAFVDAVEQQSVQLTDQLSGLPLFDPVLANAWPSYVDVRRRIDATGPVGQFLLHQLGGRRVVLDAAGGVGCESILLLRQGFTVFTNELDSRLADHARDNAASHDVKLYLTTYQWEALADSLPGNLRFDAVLVLGNSLSLVMNEQRRAQCVKAFWDILQPGGLLIIDERNYHAIQALAEDITSDPLGAFRPASKGDVMYAGARVRGYPSAIGDKKILWDFFLPNSAEHTGHPRHHLGSAPLEVYPFKYGELLRQLAEVGFSDIHVYGDLHPLAVDEMPPTGARTASFDFFTYVAQKPLD